MIDRFLWFLPTSGDGAYLGTTQGQRASTHRYLREIAQAADRLGYDGVLIPTGRGCEDAWTTAASLVDATERLRFLVAVRPGLISPTEAARQAATLDRISGGRLLVNVVCGGRPSDLAGDGIFLDHDERYAQADDFLTIWRGLLAGETVDHAGAYLRVQRARLSFPPIQQPHPPLFLGGSSAPARRLAARHVQTYLTWGEPVHQAAEKLADVRRLAKEAGRSVRFGIRLHLIVRETEREAWAAAERLIGHLSDDVIANAQRALTDDSDSEGQHRMTALHGGDRRRLEVAPNLWAGIGLVRGGAGTALVGDPATVAARLEEYAALGIDTVIASGFPHLEEAYRVAELLFPLLDRPSGDDARLKVPKAAFLGGGSLSGDLLEAPRSSGAVE